MNYENRNKASGADADSNATASKAPGASLLENALNNPVRKRYGFNILFADLNKTPKREWTKWQTQAQTDDDVRSIYSSWRPGEATCGGFVTGFRDLEAFDFDRAWVYRLWKTRFGPRADTLTVQTPNSGLRPHFLCEKPETHDEFKNSLHVELKGSGRFVVYEGKAKREDGSIGEYRVFVDKPVREDNNIIADTLAFLEETQTRYHFLFWNCLRPHFKNKVLGSPLHEVRLFIADVMACEGFSHEEIYNFFQDFSDFDPAKTDYQIRYTMDKVKTGLKPPTCETLRRTLGWKEEDCQGCQRKGSVKHEERIFLGDYRLGSKGAIAIVYDENGQPVWSVKAVSLTGYTIKKDLAKKLSLDESVVDRAVAQFMLSLRREEKDREDQQTAEGLKPIKTSLPKEELQRRALDLLSSPDLLFRVKVIYEKGVMVDRYRFVLGEEDKKLLTFIISASAKTSWPQSLWTTGNSGFGKSNLVVVTLALMPPSYSKVRSYLTGAGLRYGSQDYKILFIREWRQFAEQDIRLVSREDGSYTYEIAVRDPETHEWTTQVGEIPAKTIITTSAERLPSAQMLRRCWLLSVDETPELTSLINIRKAEYRTGKVEPASPDDIAVIQHAVMLLQPADVIIPYAELLVDLASWDRTRLDYLFDAISVVAWLHQYQRGRDSQGRIVATPADLFMAIRVCWTTLAESLLQLPERIKKCWEVLPENLKQEGMTTKEIALKLRLSQSSIRVYLSDMVNLNYAVSERKPGSREKQYWRVTPQAGSVKSATLDSSILNWKEIASLTERALRTAYSQDVLLSRGDDALLVVCDPLTGKYQQPVSPSDVAHILEDVEKDALQPAKADLGSSEVLLPKIAHVALQRMEIGREKMILSDLLPRLHERWTEGPRMVLVNRIMEIGRYNMEEAHSVVNILEKNGEIIEAPNGFLKWTR